MNNAGITSGRVLGENTRFGKAAMLRVLVLLMLVFAPFLAFWPSTVALAEQWADTVHRTYTHGYLVLGLVAWMIWRERLRLMAIAARPSVLALLLLACLGFIWLVAYRAGLQIVHQSLLPLISWVAILGCYGGAFAKRLAFPVGYLYFAFPVWDALNSLLQSTSVFAVRQMLQLAGVPAFFVGNTFQIPAGRFEIADGCSGLHFMVVALSIGALYGEIGRDSWRNRALIVVLAGALAAFTNWFRIFVIVMAGHLTEMQHYLIQGEHYNFGWMVFAVMMVVFFILARQLPLAADAEHPVASGQEQLGARAPVATVVVTIAALFSAPAFALLDSRTVATQSSRPILPEEAEGWVHGTPESPGWRPVYVGADEQQWSSFERNGLTVELFAARYWVQGQGKEMLFYQNSPVGEGVEVISGAGPASRPQWSERRIRDATDREWVLWSAYVVGDTWFTSGLRAQLSYGVHSLLGSPLSTVMLMRSACQPDCETARQGLGEFVDIAELGSRGQPAPSVSPVQRSVFE